MVIGSAAFSAAILILFWDGGLQRIVEKGLAGLLINAALMIALFLFNWPSQ